MDAFGTITWWGFTPSLDFQDEDLNLAVAKLQLHSAPETDTDVLNILMIGAGDCRHVINTISRCSRHRKKKIHFYIVENNLELYARHMMLIALFLEPQQRMGLQEKTEVFLELYGNTLVRDQAMSYVARMANMFIRMVTDPDYLDQKLPIVDLNLLKFKERDFLEGIFKFWRKNDRSQFDVEKCWDLRLRKYLGVRYDAIPNIFDWDHSMKLVEKGASIIHYQHYKQWRHKGLAFEIREGTYDVPNRTLASGVVFKQDGERIARRGYWGDILVSPYITFGIQSEEKSFFQKANNQHTKTSQDVAEYNILSMFHELVNHTKYEPPQDDPPPAKPQATLTEITEEEEAEEETETETPDGDTENNSNPLDLEYEPVPVDDIKIHFLPLNSAGDLHKKSKYQKLFNFVYISNSMVHVLKQTLTETFTNTTPVILETSKFMLELSAEQHQEYLNKIVSIAKSVNCKEVDNPDVENCYAEFVFQRDASS